ncbi:MAG: ribosome maturation factor RimP [Candidatus Omnitrophota bacterium]
MDKETLEAELKVIIADYLKEKDLDFVELIYRFEAAGLVLRVLADKPEGGITMDECFHLNREIGNLLDEKNILEERYILEVSSPGLDRPLKQINDFLRCKNRQAQIFLKVSHEGKMEYSGKIVKVDESCVYINLGAREISIPLLKIHKGKQVIQSGDKNG